MTKITLQDLGNLQNENTAVAIINANSATIETAFDNTLSRDGTAPNQMGATLDMNSNRVINLPAPIGADEPARLQELASFTATGVINAIPAGGTTGQGLVKNSNTNYDVKWANAGGTVTSVGLSAPAEFTVTNSPVTTSGTLTVTKVNQNANLVYAGPNTGAAAAPTFRSLVPADLPTITLTGDVGGSAAGGTVTTAIGVNKVTNSMLAQAADSTIRSNISGSTGNVSDNTITAVMDKQLGSTQGTIAYRNATSWVGLPPGTAGQSLQSGGAGANPSWASGAGTGTVTNVATSGIITGGPITTTGTIAVNAAVTPEGRITFSSGVPVMTSSVLAAGTVYYTPYLGNLVPIYDGSNMIPTACAELSQAATDATKSPAAVAASKVYDLFVWNDSGTIRCTRGPAWTNDTTRGYTLTMVNGILLNTSSITNGPAASRGTWVGTIRSNGTSTFDWQLGGSASGGTAAFLGLWNMYNRVRVSTQTLDNGTSYTYSSATARQYRASTGMQATYVHGNGDEAVQANATSLMQPASTAGANGNMGIGLDSTTSYANGYAWYAYNNAAATLLSSPSIAWNGNLGLGVHFISLNQAGDGTNNTTYNLSNTPLTLTINC